MSLEMRVAIIVNPEMPLGLLANTTSAIAIGLGAKYPVLGGYPLRDANDQSVEACSIVPVPLLQGDNNTLRNILLKALQYQGDRAIVPFAAFSRTLSSWEEDQAVFPTKKLIEEDIDGLGIAGPEMWIKSLTGSLKLLR